MKHPVPIAIVIMIFILYMFVLKLCIRKHRFSNRAVFQESRTALKLELPILTIQKDLLYLQLHRNRQFRC